MTEKLIRNEKEAIDCLRKNKPTSGYYMLQESVEMAIQALEEIQQYRAIGTVEELQKMKDDYAEAITDWRRYKKIGTIELFRELTENNDRIIEILRTHRFTDEECVKEIVKIIGICSHD